MFSFLVKKKDRDAPVDIIIKGPSTGSQNSGGNEDFIFVENQGNTDPSRPQMPMYPPMPSQFGVTPMYPGGSAGIPMALRTPPPIPYVQDVPFVLAPALCTKSTYEATQTEVDGILAILTRQMSMDNEEEYSFALERSTIEDEC